MILKRYRLLYALHSSCYTLQPLFSTPDLYRSFTITSQFNMPSKQADEVVSKEGQPIQEGDHVYTKIRGGRHEGDVRLLPSFTFPLPPVLADIGVHTGRKDRNNERRSGCRGRQESAQGMYTQYFALPLYDLWAVLI